MPSSEPSSRLHPGGEEPTPAGPSRRGPARPGPSDPRPKAGRGARVAAVVCANGLGHFRRLVGIVDALRRLREPRDVTLICEDWQVRRMRSWWRLRDLLAAGARVRSGILAPGVGWSADAGDYGDGRLRAWLPRLAGVEELAAADLVLSDNLPGVLELRPDAVLAGSFLWSDVLGEAHGGHPEVARMVAWERDLLAQHSPPMLCVGEMAMPGVLERTAAVRLGWMGEIAGDAAAPADGDGDGRPRIAVLGGATGAAGGLLRRAARELAADGRWQVVAAAGLADDGVPDFGYAPADFAACAAVVCRPGMGTLSDCVAHRLPVVALHEPRHPEMRHNARRVDELGLGRDAGSRPAAGAVAAAVAAVLRDAAEVKRRMAARPQGGLEQAARWLAAALDRRRREEATDAERR